MKGLRSACLLCTCLAILLLMGQAGGQTTETLQKGNDDRAAQIFASQISDPFPNPNCSMGKNSGNGCYWGKITLSMSLLSTNSPDYHLKASEILNDVVAALSGHEIRGRDIKEKLRSYTDEWNLEFPFVTAALLFRTVELFGESQFSDDRRLDFKTEQAIRDAFWRWAKTACHLTDSAPEMVLKPWKSENLDVQRIHTCWAAAELLHQSSYRQQYIYSDGSTPEIQAAAWGNFFKKYIQSRFQSGNFVEYFSPTYSKYSLSALYNLFDFSSDNELRVLAEQSITLWWAQWAQEQIDGVHGGSKTRFYTELMPDGTPMDGFLWFYTGDNKPQSLPKHPSYFPMLMSRYRPPEALQVLFTNLKARGTYEAWARAIGLNSGPMSEGRYNLSPNLAITRYSFVTPDYVMGSATVPRLPASRWSAISSQNRWNGLVMAGGNGDRIYATALPQGGRSTYNAIQAVQSRGTQMVVKLPAPYSRGAGPMIVHVGPHLHRVERGGWIFAEGSAYAAVRPAFGTCDVATLPGVSLQDCRLSDDTSPVILQAGRRADYASFQAFQDAVLAASLEVTSQDVRFQGLDGAGTVSFSFNGERAPEVNGKPVSAPAGWTLYSPFIHQREGSPIVNIETRAGKLQLNFQ